MPPIVASAGTQARHVGQTIADTIRQNENENTKPETNNTNPHPDFAPSGASPCLSATKGQARYQSRRRPGRSGGGIPGTAHHSHQQLIGSELLLRGLFAEIDRIRVLKPRIIDSFALVAEKRYNR